ncbi:MAG: hypothetical protein NT067_04425 [Candidatus Diapherotrites archaeon]|nr:hypothetical protein [Candidatus Diapherotrites archaeon]
MAKRARLQVEGRIGRRLTAKKISRGRIAERGYEVKRELIFGSSLRKVWEKDKGISQYEQYFGFAGKRSKGSVKGIVEAKSAALGRPVRVLDVGCGNCYFLAELGDLFGNRVDLEGISLAKPLTPKKWSEESEKMRVPLRHLEWEGALRQMNREFHERIKAKELTVHTGLAETHDYGKKFDLIFSVETIRRSINPVKALVNTLGQLAAGGEAFIHLTVGEFGIGLLRKRIQGRTLGEWLTEQGIETIRLKPGVYHFVKKTDKEIMIPEF